ncbi:hypothetical protein B5M09_002072 [Aphanomyces astaci]|nr:hypothetical protein B5M09_002072 [Aphanomyces astaci]
MPVATLRHHSNECRVVTWSPADGSLLLTASFDGTTCVLDDNGNVRGTFRENKEMILQGCWHPSIPAFATSSGDKMLKLWKFTV